MEGVEEMVVMGEGVLVLLLVNVVVVVVEDEVEVEHAAFFFCFDSPPLLGVLSIHLPINILVSVMNSF